MLHKLVFDTTDVESIQDSHNVGAYVRAGKGGAIITYHADQQANAATSAFTDTDVTAGSDEITLTAHAFNNGDKVQFTTDDTLPDPLAVLTDYWVIYVDANTVKVAASQKDAELGIAIDLTDGGTGNHSMNGQVFEIRALDVHVINPVNVSATDLDIRDLTQADEITVFQGTDPWVVSATDLDIRDLDAAQDSVASWLNDGAGNPISSTGGAIDVNIASSDISINVDLQNGAEYAEDSAHSNADVGNYVLAVRSDARPTNANTSTDGDYASLFVNVNGELYVKDTDAAVELLDQGTTLDSILAGLDAALANTAIAANSNTLGAANVAEDVVASPLANRKYLFIYNNDNRELFIGPSGVLAANGFPLPPGSMLPLRAGAAIDIEWVSSKTGHDLRHLELS